MLKSNHQGRHCRAVVAFFLLLLSMPVLGQSDPIPYVVTLAESVDATVVAERIAACRPGKRALAALHCEGSVVAEAISHILTRHGIPHRPLWIVRGVAVNLTAQQHALLRDEYPTFRFEPIPDLTISTAAPNRLDTPETAMRADAPWNMTMCGSKSLKQTLNLTGRQTLIGAIGPNLTVKHPSLNGKVLTFKQFGPPLIKEDVDLEDLRLLHPLGIAMGRDKERFEGAATDAELCLAALPNRGNLSIPDFLEAMQWLVEPYPDLIPTAILICLDVPGKVPEAVRTALQACRTAGILPVVPSGNQGYLVRGMAALPEVVTIGALTQWKNRALFSATGPGAVDGLSVMKPDFAEPGVAITGPSQYKNQYRSGSGTLQAAAHFVGIFAQLRESRPADDLEVVLAAMRATAIDIAATGPDMETGYGLPDPIAAIAYLENPPAPEE